MDDDGDRFEIVLACRSHRAEEVGENVSARSLLFDWPDIAAALHFTFDDCAPTLFRTGFIASVFPEPAAGQNPHTNCQWARSGTSTRRAMVCFMRACASHAFCRSRLTARPSDGIMSQQVHHIGMSKSTPTLTQSGLLAVLLEHQRCKAMRLARRRARLRQMRVAFRWPYFWRHKAFAQPKLLRLQRDLSAR
jgi:hypothetical protein